MYGVGDEGLFEQLFKMLQSSGPVNWKLAREVTKSVAGQQSPIEPSVAEEYRELFHVAEIRVSSLIDLPSPQPRELNPTDRATWAAENQQSFHSLFEPLGEKFSSLTGPEAGDAVIDVSAMLGPAILGMQAGTMIGLIAHHALGQFDTGIPAMDNDRPYVIVPNLDDFAIDNGIDHRQIRLWGALHEVIYHRVMSVEWIKNRFVELITEHYENIEIDTTEMLEKLTSISDPVELQQLIGEGEDPSNLIQTTSDPERLADIQAFTAFTEGYTDWVVRASGSELLPDIDRIEDAYETHRSNPEGGERVLEQIAGLALERWRASDAVKFCIEVNERWGEDALNRVWESPENMPRLAEITDPIGWNARVLLDESYL